MPRGHERILIYVRERDAAGRPVVRAVPAEGERPTDPPRPGTDEARSRWCPHPGSNRDALAGCGF